MPFVGRHIVTYPIYWCCELGARVGRLLVFLRLSMAASAAAAAAVAAVAADDLISESTVTIFLLGLVGVICALGVIFC